MTATPPAGHRIRAAAQRARKAVADLQSPRRTALATPRDRVPPPPTAFARWGERSFLVPPARVVGAEAIEIGDDVVILEDAGLAVDASRARLVIGDRTRLAVGVEIVCTVGVTIGAAVSSSDYACITDSWATIAHPPGPAPPTGGPIVIEDGAYLGWGSVVGPGVTVGTGAFVGEGAIVLDDVDPHTVVYGNPARVVRRLDAGTGEWIGGRFP